MQKFLLVQFGIGGMSWLIFIVGLLWCSFSWWRAYRCKRALICIISAITSLVSGLLTIIILVSMSMRFFRSTTGSNGDMLEIIALTLFILTGASWAISSIAFFLAAITSRYPTRDELAAEISPPSPLSNHS